MTLLELVVALTITGLALSSGYEAFGTLADRRMAEEARANAVARTVSIRASLVSWLSNARLTIEEDDIVFRGLDGVHKSTDNDLPDDDLTFFTSAETPVGNHGTIIRLHVERSDTAASRGLIADLTEWHGTRTLRLPIDTAVGGLNGEYLSSVLGGHRWLASWVSSSVLPAGVRVTLTPFPGDSLAPLMRMPMTVSLENGR